MEAGPGPGVHGHSGPTSPPPPQDRGLTPAATPIAFYSKLTVVCPLAAGALHGFRQQGAVCELHQAAAGPRPAHQVSASLVPPKTLGCQEPPGLPRVRFWVLLLEAGLPLAPGHGGHRQQGQELSQLPLLQGRADTGRLSPARSPGPLLLPGLPTAPTCQLQSPSHCLWPQL